jgi:hypothetical protein
MPHPRHDISRYLEEITKPVIIKKLPDQLEKCKEFKFRIAKMLKFTTADVSIRITYCLFPSNRSSIVKKILKNRLPIMRNFWLIMLFK